MNLLKPLFASWTLLLAISPAAFAGPIVFSESSINVAGPSAQNFAFGSTMMLVSAAPRGFSRKTVGAVGDQSTGVGVAGGNVDGEIDPNGSSGAVSESISFFWNDPVVLDSLNLSFLYPNGEFSDVGNEQARVTVLTVAGPVVQLFLTATGETNGTWIGGGGILTNITTARDGSPGPAGGGEWNVRGDLFGGPITGLILQSPSPSPGTSAKSDFSFVELQGANVSVPEPSSLALACLALAGLGFRGRKLPRQQAKAH